MHMWGDSNLLRPAAQVMEEGERLSIKQGNMESTIKKLRSQIKEQEASHTQAAARLAAEESKLEAASKARQKAETAAAAAQQQHKAESEQQRQHYEALLKQAHASQVQRDHCCTHHCSTFMLYMRCSAMCIPNSKGRRTYSITALCHPFAYALPCAV